MRARVRVGKGLKKLGYNIDKLYLELPKVCEKAVYEAAAIPADALRSQIESVPVSQYDGKKNRDPYFWGKGGDKPKEPIDGLTQSQKDGLLEALGISPFRTGILKVDKHVGVDGYNRTVTKRYRKGQPNAMVLRSLEKGTRYHQKYSVVRNAANATRAKTRKLAAEVFTKEIKQRIGA